MTRDEHLTWAKNRAIEYVDANDPRNAMMSMMSDLRKHKELEDHAGIMLGGMLLMTGELKTAAEVRKFIMDFN